MVKTKGSLRKLALRAGVVVALVLALTMVVAKSLWDQRSEQKAFVAVGSRLNREMYTLDKCSRTIMGLDTLWFMRLRLSPRGLETLTRVPPSAADSMIPSNLAEYTKERGPSWWLPASAAPFQVMEFPVAEEGGRPWRVFAFLGEGSNDMFVFIYPD
jgi:hypothetical protein